MALLTESFDLIRVINLPDRTDRYNEATRQLHALGLDWKLGSVDLYAATRPTELAGFPSLGAHGCFMSHLNVLRDALHRGVESVLVLEDDCEVPLKNCRSVGDVALNLKTRPWQFVHFGHIAPVAPPLQDAAPTLLEFEGSLQNLHMYGVHRSALAALVEYLEGCIVRPPGDPIGGPMHVDGALTMFRTAHPEFVTLIAQPSLADQRSSRSDITFGAYESVPGLKQAMGVARKIKRALKSKR
jgi:glycosyl transferase family 25